MSGVVNLIRTHDSGFVAADAERDLRRARRHRAWSRLWGRLRRSSSRTIGLLAFDDVAAELGATARHDLGVQPVDLDTIVGSVGRSGDFDRCFRPGPKIDGRRWESLDRAMRSGQSLPPITVYRIGGLHYVQDGHHRVSVAHAVGLSTVDAFVTEVMTAA
jgi:hypothetical protein